MSQSDASYVAGEIIAGLEALGIEYLIGGSFASSAWGLFRPTHDLDIVVLINHSSVQPLIDRFGEDFAVSAEEIEDAIASNEPYASFQMLHFDRIFKVDAFVMDGSAYSLAQMARRRRIELLPGLPAWVASPEDVVIQKLRWYELGNRVSDRQWNDIVQVIEVQGAALDRDYMREWAGKLSIAELLEEALKEALS